MISNKQDAITEILYDFAMVNNLGGVLTYGDLRNTAMSILVALEKFEPAPAPAPTGDYTTVEDLDKVRCGHGVIDANGTEWIRLSSSFWQSIEDSGGGALRYIDRVALPANDSTSNV